MKDVALDTNILVYFAGVTHISDDTRKIERVDALITRLDEGNRIVIPTQVFGELFNVLIKSGRSREIALKSVEYVARRFPAIGEGFTTMMEALGLAAQHKLQIWDALILASASEASCAILLSEDMQDGFCWRGVSIVNPFGDRAAAALFG